ncbi:MAG TPA: hypothetical protein VGF48_01560 [Thermoanaerobaculia bacterium]|jgi:hypothetical protein
MSKNNNVNPGFYQTAGREHTDGPDQGEIHENNKQRLAQSKKDEGENFIPGAAPVGQSGQSQKAKKK